jgi:hypothetical protein
MLRNPEDYVAAPYTDSDLEQMERFEGSAKKLTKEQKEGLEKIKEFQKQLEKDRKVFKYSGPHQPGSDYVKDAKKQFEKQEREINQLKTGLGSLDYLSDTKMLDGKQYDPESPLHYVEADVTTLAALEAQKDGDIRDAEAAKIADKRRQDLVSLIDLLSGNMSYTLAENALVVKAASKYAVVSDKNGRLKLASIANNNRNGVAIVSLDAADAVIRELRAGKNLKEAFLDGMQASTDRAIKENLRKDGWQKFKQVERNETEQDLTKLYTDEEVDKAWGKSGYEFGDNNELIHYLIRDGLLPDRRVKNTAFEKRLLN